MRKFSKIMGSILMIMALSTSNVGASVTVNTNGYLGSNATTLSIESTGNSSFTHVNFKNNSRQRVETIGIKNINVITSSGGGETGKSAVKNNEFICTYSSPYFGGILVSASGSFYVKSSNFGSFTYNLSY